MTTTPPPKIPYQLGYLNRFKANLLSVLASRGASLVGIYDTGSFFSDSTVEAALQVLGIAFPGHVIADPGNAGAIPVTKSGSVMLTSVGVEARLLPIPTYKGQRLALNCNTFVGAITLIVAQAVNQTGNNTLVFGAARDNCVLFAITVGGALRWQVIHNDGVALSTV